MRERAVLVLRGEQEPALEELRRGWCLGGESFRERMLRLLESAGERLRQRRDVDGSVRRAHDETEASRLLGIGLARLNLTAKELPHLPKGDVRKLAIARVIRRRTATANRWIAQALAIGHSSRLNHRPAKLEPEIQKLADAVEQCARLSD